MQYLCCLVTSQYSGGSWTTLTDCVRQRRALLECRIFAFKPCFKCSHSGQVTCHYSMCIECCTLMYGSECPCVHCAQGCLSHHRVFQGREALFSGKEAIYNAVDSHELTVFIPGHAEFRQLVWLMIPLMFGFHILAILVLLCTLASPTDGHQYSRYFWPIPQAQQDKGIHGFFLFTLWRTAFILMVLGAGIMMLNLFSPAFYALSGCSDPLLFTTIRGIQVDGIYEWCVFPRLADTEKLGLCTGAGLHRSAVCSSASLGIQSPSRKTTREEGSFPCMHTG